MFICYNSHTVHLNIAAFTLCLKFSNIVPFSLRPVCSGCRENLSKSIDICSHDMSCLWMLFQLCIPGLPLSKPYMYLSITVPLVGAPTPDYCERKRRLNFLSIQEMTSRPSSRRSPWWRNASTKTSWPTSAATTGAECFDVVLHNP